MIKGLVSVIIPTYKRPKMLKRAIDSVLNQTYSNIEVIVIDDNNSKDEFRIETIEFMKQYGNNPKVIYIQHEQNQNGSAARNTGILRAQGEYIAFLDDDDYFFPKNIELKVTKLAELPDSFGGISSNYAIRYLTSIYKITNLKEKYDSCYELLSGKGVFPTSTFVFRRSAINKIGLFDISFSRHQDLEYLIRFFREYSLFVLADVTVIQSADGIRNRPNTDKLNAIKSKMLSLFQADIDVMSKKQKENISMHQNKELIYSALKERRYGLAYSFYNERKNKMSILKSLPYLSLAFIVGLCPYAIVLVYHVLDGKNRIIKKSTYRLIKKR